VSLVPSCLESQESLVCMKTEMVGGSMGVVCTLLMSLTYD
jgi:hypothetical protein